MYLIEASTFYISPIDAVQRKYENIRRSWKDDEDDSRKEQQKVTSKKKKYRARRKRVSEKKVSHSYAIFSRSLIVAVPLCWKKRRRIGKSCHLTICLKSQMTAVMVRSLLFIPYSGDHRVS